MADSEIYVDESGQDTGGALFTVAALLTRYELTRPSSLGR